MVSSVLLSVGCGPAVTPAEGSLGRVDLTVSCDAPVQAELNHATALLHHMTYPVARSEYRRITAGHPECAMGYWGEAMTLFQPLWPTRPGPDDLRRGWEAVQAAERVGTPTPRESLFVATARAFFDPTGEPDYWTRIDRWAAATADLHRAYPLDLEAKAFYALSRLAVAGRSADPGAVYDEAAGILLAIYDAEPTHPGAVHYTIHANDVDGRQGQSLSIVESYGEIAPANPHALHMPTHIYVRLGEWAKVISWNERAAEAGLAQRVGDNGEYVWSEYPHAVEYLVYAHLQRGDDSAAAAAIEALHAIPNLQPDFKSAFHLASTKARYALERAAWSEAAAIHVREPETVAWDKFPWAEAISWFARGIGGARSGNPAVSEESRAELARLEEHTRAVGETYFATQIQLLRLEVDAWIALAAGKDQQAVSLMREAVALELATPKHPVTPGATLPAQELLGDLLMEIGDVEGASEAYRASNARLPGRYDGILGAARAAVALGDEAAARDSYARLMATVADNTTRPGVAEATRYRIGNE